MSTCPFCDTRIAENTTVCATCGTRVIRVEAGMMKTSAVLIACDDFQAVYPSVDEVPEPLRGKLIDSTSGENSGTFVIADRRGKQKVQSKVARAAPTPEPAVRAEQSPVSSRSRRWHPYIWPAFAGAAILLVAVWLMLAYR